MNNCKIAQYEIYDGYIAEKNRWTANVKWHILLAYPLERTFDLADGRGGKAFRPGRPEA